LAKATQIFSYSMFKRWKTGDKSTNQISRICLY
jgi:hypothetical protein